MDARPSSQSLQSIGNEEVDSLYREISTNPRKLGQRAFEGETQLMRSKSCM